MWPIVEGRGRRLGTGNRVVKVSAHLLAAYSAHSLKDNYSFAIDLKISEILASAKPFLVEKYRRAARVWVRRCPERVMPAAARKRGPRGGREGGKGVPK